MLHLRLGVKTKINLHMPIPTKHKKQHLLQSRFHQIPNGQTSYLQSIQKAHCKLTPSIVFAQASHEYFTLWNDVFTNYTNQTRAAISHPSYQSRLRVSETSITPWRFPKSQALQVLSSHPIFSLQHSVLVSYLASQLLARPPHGASPVQSWTHFWSVQFM